MKVVIKLRQLLELDFVIGEIFLILHVVYVSVLNVLQEEKHASVGKPESHVQTFPK